LGRRGSYEGVMKVGGYEKEAGKDESGEKGEEAGVPELVGVEADDSCGAQAEGEGGHEAKGSEDAEGRKEEMTGVDEVGVHVRGLIQRSFPFGYAQNQDDEL